MKEHRAITEAEVQYLFQFLDKKGIPYLDLKIELLDHLAAGIEACWQLNPGLPVEVALQHIYGEFGVFGFGKILEQKRKLINKSSVRHLHQAAFHRLQGPQLAGFSLMALVLTYLCMTYSRGVHLFLSSFLCMILVIAMVSFQQQRYSKQQGHQFLFLKAPFKFFSRLIHLCFSGLLIWFIWNHASYLPFPLALSATGMLLYFSLLTLELVLYQKKENQNKMEAMIKMTAKIAPLSGKNY